MKLQFHFKTKGLSRVNTFAEDQKQATTDSTTAANKACMKILTLSLLLSQGV